MVEFLKRNDKRACPSVHHGSKSNRWTDWKGKDWFRCNCPWRSARAQLGEGEHCIKDWQWPDQAARAQIRREERHNWRHRNSRRALTLLVTMSTSSGKVTV
jgi:hypothetical protein